jgi:hypothetical protein
MAASLPTEDQGVLWPRLGQTSHERSEYPVVSPSLRSGQAPRATGLFFPVGRAATTQSTVLAIRFNTFIIF